MADAHAKPHHDYHLVDPSPWPIIGAVGGLLTVLGIIFAAHFGSYITLVAGAVVVLGTMFFWWRDVIRESRTPGLHTPVVRLGLRYGMLFFISSEVMLTTSNCAWVTTMRSTPISRPASMTASASLGDK